MLVLVGFVALAVPRAASADGWDLAVFGGIAYPTYEQRFVVRPPTSPTLPGLVISQSGEVTLDAKGGGVFGAAFTGEFAGRWGSRRGSTRRPSTSGRAGSATTSRPGCRRTPASGSVAVAGGTLETDRLSLFSVNLRLRTPGPVSFVASGGLSYLPSFRITGSTPVRISIDGFVPFETTGSFTLRVAPTESSHRFGVNVGAGLRAKVAPAVAIFGEGRVFSFREYALTLNTDDPRFIGQVDQLRFSPVVVNVVGGVAFSF